MSSSGFTFEIGFYYGRTCIENIFSLDQIMIFTFMNSSFDKLNLHLQKQNFTLNINFY